MRIKNKGFIPILIALAISIFIGGGAYITYRITKPSEDISLIEQTSNEGTATTTIDFSNKSEINEEDSESEDPKDSIIYSLKKQVSDLVKQINEPVIHEPKTSVVTLPSGAVIEIDSNGNTIRIIKEAPPVITQNNPQSEQNTQTTNQNTSQSQAEVTPKPIPVKITISDSHELPGLFCSQTEFTVHIFDKNNIEIPGENVEVLNTYTGVSKSGTSPFKVNFGLNDMKEADLLFKIKSGGLEIQQGFVVYEPNFRLITIEGHVIDPNHESGTFIADSDGTYPDQRGGLKLIKLDSGFVCKH